MVCSDRVALQRRAPDLDRQPVGGAVAGADEPGPRHACARQPVEPVGGAGAGPADQGAAERDELVVERHAGQVRADDGDLRPWPERLRLQVGLAAPARREVEQRPVGEGRRDELGAERQPVAATDPTGTATAHRSSRLTKLV